MNKARRALLTKAATLIEEARAFIEEAQQGEDEAFNNLPQSLQDSDKGQAMFEAADTLMTVFDNLDDAVFELDSVAELVP